MDTRKLSFRLLSVLTCAVSILLLAAACASAPTHRCEEWFLSIELEEFRKPLTHSLEVTPRVAAYGEAVMMKQTLQNVTTGNGRDIQLVLADEPPAGFLITKPNGDYVWESFCFSIGHATLRYYHLGPGEVEEFALRWDPKDVWNQRVPAGTYLVRGLLNGADPDSMWTTEAIEVEILPEE